MKALLTCVVSGLGLFTLLATSSAQTADSGPRTLTRPGDSFHYLLQEFVRIDIQGPIHQERHIFPGGTLWHITANGHTYALDLGKSKTGPLKDGMTIRVTGKLTERVYSSLLRTMEYPPREWPPLRLWTVVADTVATIDDKNPATFARVTVRGTLNLNAVVGYPGQTLKIVTSDSQMIVLDLGIMTGLGMLKVQELDGKLIDLEGEIAGFHKVVTMCVPDRQELPIVHVQKLTQARSGRVLER